MIIRFSSIYLITWVKDIYVSHIRHLLQLVAALAAFLFIASEVSGQSVGDYRTNATGTWNWTNASNWQRCENVGSWAGASSVTYPGQNPGAGAVSILNNTVVNVTTAIPNSIGSLTISGGTNISDVNVQNNGNLSVTGATTLLADSNNDYKFVTVSGIFSSGSINTSGLGNIQDAFLEIVNGTVNVSGNITLNTANANRNYILFSGPGILNIQGSFGPNCYITSTLGGGGAPVSGTLNYNNAGIQTIGSTTYYNLTLSNSGTKTLAGVITVGNNLDISGTSILASDRYQITGNAIGNVTMAAGTGLTLGNTANNADILFPTAYTAGRILLDNSSTVTYQNNLTQTVSLVPAYGNLILATGSTKTANGNLTVNGNLTINNATTFSAGTIASAWNIAGITTIDGTLDFGGTNAKTINLGNDLVNVTGTITMQGAGLLHTLNLGGTNNDIGTFNTSAVASTVNYNRTGDQQVFASANYRKLTVSNGGNKTMQGALTVNDVLTLNSGVLQMGDYNLTLANNIATAVQGTLNSTSMVESNGNGYFIRNTNATLPIAFPLGSGGYYSPISITARNAVGGTFSAKAVSTGSLGSKFVSKYWDVIASVAGNTITAGFQYDPAEASVAPSIIWVKPNAGSWQLPAGTSGFGANTFTITGTSNITTTASSWSASALGTYYSYQTGDWNNPTTWTSDPGGTTQVGSTIPANNDVAIILDSRTVTLPANIATTGLEIRINSGGVLDMSTYGFTAGLLKLSGQGTLKLASTSFPAAATNNFVLAGGGTAIYYNAANFTLPAAQAIYNNLQIDAPGIIVTQLSDLSLNGNLYIKRGTYRINDNASTTKRNLIINGNVTINAGAFMAVGKGATNTTTNPLSISGGAAPYTNYYEQFHRIVLMGDFTNNGTARFTNLAIPVYNAFPTTTSGAATAGAVSVYFRGSSNNTLFCNGTTDFYNLILDKGTDQTYQLIIQPTAYNNFRLFGANISGGENGTANPDLKKALWIRTGTLDLKGMTVIPSLTEGAAGGNPVSDFVIPANGALILDGTEVVVLSTADDYREVNAAYGVSGGSGSVNGVNVAVNPQALVIYGKLQVNNGYLSTRESAGLLYSNVGSGQFELNGGIVDTKQIRENGTTGSGASFVLNAGDLLLRGRFQRTPLQYTNAGDLSNVSAATLNTSRLASGTSSSQGTLNINNASNVFAVSGGTISIYDVCGTVSPAYALDIRSSSANTNVTGGTIEILPSTGTGLADAATQLIYSTSAPFGNLTINRGAGCASDVQLNTFPITVLANLTLTSGLFTANNLDVTIGGNFFVENGTTYNSGTNTTVFNGNINQLFTISGTINNGVAGLRNILINKSSGTLALAGTQPSLTIQGTLDLTNGTLDDGGKIVYVSGNLSNSGSFISTPGTGKVQINGTTVQTIGGNGNGSFLNLELNNTNAAAAPVSLLANTTINGELTFSQNKLFNIGTYALTLNASATIINGGANRYIQTNGDAGDGGIKRFYSASSPSFTFPVGAPTKTPVNGVKYTPATLAINGTPTSYGYINVIPVGYEHPATKVNGFSLTYFWRVRSGGITLGPASITHGYYYGQVDVPIAGVAENEFVAARYNAPTYSWTNGTANDVDETNNIIGEPGTGSFLENVSYIDGDYTAGDNVGQNPFAAPNKYYSRQNGPWSALATWSLTDHTTTNPPATAPGVNDIVIIGNGNTINLTANASCASLQIESGSILDIFTWSTVASNFGMVLSHPNGNGLFRLTTTVGSPKLFTFPSGDFTDFNVNDGTTEFYDIDGATGAEYILPANVTSYGNLILTARGGDNLILPNNTYTTIKGDLTCTGDNPDAWVTMSWLTAGVYTPVVEKTVHVTGNMYINNGTFLFLDDQAPQHLIVDGNVTIAPTAIFDVYNGYPVNNGGAVRLNSFEIGGSLINNSNVNPSARFITGNNYVNLIFSGSTDASITNTVGGATPNIIFNKVTVNKGSSQATTLTCDIAGSISVPADNWLTLQSGTFRYERTGNLPIATTSTFTIPGTSGLYINTPSNVYIARSNSNTNDLFLNGKLTIVSGNVYVGREAGTDNNNNDIEYSGGGLSEIDIQGGLLMVNGQIRRNVAMSNGVLRYSQSGNSTVTINGQNCPASNAKLEILNAGSEFNMSGNATLNIIRGGGGNTYGDLYLRPGASSVTGGTIVFAHNISGSNQSYLLDANVPFNNLTITGRTAATAANALVNLMVNPLVLNGTLTLTNANSILNSNNIDISIKGNLTNNGNTASYLYGTNTTIFNGNTQAINGSVVTNFYNLSVSPVTSLTLGQNMTVFHDLRLDYGTFICGNYAVNVKNNITNNATYTDSQFGVILNNTTAQQLISGTGTFGRLELDNPFGAKITNDISLQRDLVLTQGILDLSQYLLTLGQNSTIGGAPFSALKMITSNGVYSNIGIRKYFNTGATTFTYPMGVGGKYTPADLTITANGSVGYIRINGINGNHPAVINPAEVLKYYWEVETSGITGFAGNLVFNYLQSDVQGTKEDEYIAARLIVPPSTSWSKATVGSGTDNVDEINNKITFTFPAGTSNLGGEYTAGLTAAIPDDVPIYQSISNGNWTDKTIWQPVAPTVDPCPDGGPNGYIVIINNTVTADANNCFAYRTAINGELFVDGSYSGHNLGIVTGSGKLHLENGILPAGRFTAFFDCSNNGILEYGGTGTYTMIADRIDNVPNLYFTGSGTRILPNKDLTICNELRINGPLLDNSINNRKLTILGSMNLLSGAFNSGTGSYATVSFAGTAAQALTGFTGSNALNNFEINNAAGINFTGNNEVNGNLLLTNGIIHTSNANLLTVTNTNPNCVIPNGGNASSFVNGPLVKRILTGESFQFPIGKNTTLGNKITLYATQGGASYLDWKAEYFTPNPYSAFNAPLTDVNNKEYWQISAPSGSAAIVSLAWDPMSNLTPLMTQNGLSDMRVAGYDGSFWNQITSTAAGDDYNGFVSTFSRTAIPATGNANYSIACINTIKPKATLTPSGPVCGISGIPVTFTSPNPAFDYILSYKYNGVAQAPVSVSALPYALPTSSSGGTYQLTGFTYNNGAGTGVVDQSVITTYAVPTTANAGTDIATCGATTTFLSGNNPAVGTGLWTIISGTGGTITTPSSNVSGFGGIYGSAYALRWTISNGTCTSSDDMNVNFNISPTQPSTFTASANPVCQGQSAAVYTVPNDVNATSYNWSYSGSGATITGTGNSISMDFSSSATAGTISVSTTNGCGTSTALTLAISVNPLPNQPGVFTVSTSPVCAGSAGVIYTVLNDATVSYSWSYSGSGATINGTTNSVTVDFNNSATSGTLGVTATNGCGTSIARTMNVMVNPRPTPLLTGTTAVCAGGIEIYSSDAGNSGYTWSVTGGTISSGGTATDATATITWSTLGDQTVNVNYTDTNGCTAIADTQLPVHVYKRPETGPAYYVPNNFNP